jgi:uncharacterized NAD(P)/FAD-binding protein YdhS
MSNSSLDAGIPVLTEVIATPQTEFRQAGAPAAKSDDAPALPIAELDEEAWNRMEREIRERILYQVLERVDFVLEQRVRDGLADVLQTAVDSLANELRNGLHISIKELVTRAVAQEITKLQSTKE